MSLAIQQLETVNVYEPRVKINDVRRYAIVKGGMVSTWKTIPSTAYSNSQIQITAPPPNPAVIVDRKVYLNVPMTIGFTGTYGSGTSQTGASFLQIGVNDAPKAYPISNSIIVANAQINNTTVSVNLNDTIGALLRYNTDADTRQYDYSMSPSMLDQYQNYGDWVTLGSARNPLAMYGEISNEEARGGFPMELQYNSTGASGATGSALVFMSPTEPLFLSPFEFGHRNASGFIGVQTLNFQFTFDPNMFYRVWSHAAVSGGNTLGNVSVSIGAPYGAPQMFFNYITPQQLMSIPKSCVYKYNIVDRYLSPPTALSAGPRSTTTISSNNIQLTSIPQKLLIYARRQNSDLSFNNSSDVYAQIEALTINWNNNSGLLSGASAYDLYRMSRDNGVNISWPQWHCQVPQLGGTALNYINPTSVNGVNGGYVGSVLCVDMGKDIGLPDLECPGMLGTFQLQMNVTISNPNLSNTVNYVLYIVPLSEGTFTITNNQSIAQTGVVSKEDVLSAKQNPFIDYAEAMAPYGGGNFFGGLKDFFSGAYNKAKDVVNTVSPYVKTAIDVGKQVAPYLPLVGLGEGEGGAVVGGAVVGGASSGGRRHKRQSHSSEEKINVGGKMMTRAMLKKHLRID